MKDLPLAKAVVFVNSLIPAVILAWDAYTQNLGPSPTAEARNTTGILAVIFLWLSLTITPLRTITGWNWIIFARKMLGLFGFFYALLHFAIYFTFERQLDITSLVSEIWNRPFILFGAIAITLLIPLAATSFNGAIKKLGPKRWRLLHRLAYVIAILAVIHFYLAQKRDVGLPIGFIVVLTILLGFRIIAAMMKKTPKAKVAPKKELAV